MAETRVSRQRSLRTPFGDLELRWWVRRPRVYRAGGKIEAPERPASEAVLAAPQELTWIEISMVDEEGDPVPGEAYEITLPDGSVQRGKLNFRGRARIDDISDAGACTVRFPDLDADAWERL